MSSFEKGVVTIQYKGDDKTFDTYTRPLWDWARSLIQDTPFIFSGLPDDPAAKPVCFVVYADKSKLSSFGTQKAYAVVARLANLPTVIRNNTRFGGGQVVGHQPIVKNDPQCVMGLYPCPICFVPWNEQSDFSTEHPLRTGRHSEKILGDARALRTAAEKEELLKDNGLRDVENAERFLEDWGFPPPAAISYDPLHADDGGFVKARATELGREAIVKIDTQMATVPRWRGLSHFKTVMNTSLNDGSKHEDIAKTMLFVAHNVLEDDVGLLLQAVRSYLELRTSIGFQVHTSETIAIRKKPPLLI
ncbi:hypothetical protein DFH09DRAFT_1082389 [Mycena vulgaris]|nr:hypothetical protein DFH09DRAFT_1082389 [Mycena vulgaris]